MSSILKSFKWPLYSEFQMSFAVMTFVAEDLKTLVIGQTTTFWALPERNSLWPKIKSRPKKSLYRAYSKYVVFGIAIGAYTDAEWTLRPPLQETLRPI